MEMEILNPPSYPHCMQDHISAKCFGAAGNGYREDTSAIQAAIDLGKNIGIDGDNTAEGITVYLPPGNYRISDTLRVYGGTGGRTHLMGAGSGSTTITLANNSDVDMLHLEPMFSSNEGIGHHHSVISNLRLFGNRENQTQEELVGIQARRAFSGCVLRNLKVDNIAGTGIRFEQASNPSIENVGIARASHYGLLIDGGEGRSNHDSLNFTNLEVGDCRLAGVYIRGQTDHWTNILFVNFRAEANVVGMFDMVRLQDCNNIPVTFISPKFHVVGTAPNGEYRGFHIVAPDEVPPPAGTRPRLTVIGWAATETPPPDPTPENPDPPPPNVMRLDHIIRDELGGDPIPGDVDVNPVIYYNHTPLVRTFPP